MIRRIMLSLQVVACMGITAGLLLLLRINLTDFTGNIFRKMLGRKKGLRETIRAEMKQKKKPYLERELEEVQAILTVTGRAERLPFILTCAVLFFAAGAAGAVMMGNIFMLPVAAGGCMFLPFWYVRLTANHYQKDIAAELETALSIITTAYLRNEDILTAVEENIEYLNDPVKGVFKSFAKGIRFINPDRERALEELKGKIPNEVFTEWVDALRGCLYDRSLKTTLTPIVAKLSDMRIVNAELEYLVFEPRKEFLSMVVLVVGNIPLLYFMNRAWYDTLMGTAAGKLMLSITGAIIFVSAAAVIKLTRPIEYRS